MPFGVQTLCARLGASCQGAGPAEGLTSVIAGDHRLCEMLVMLPYLPGPFGSGRGKVVRRFATGVTGFLEGPYAGSKQ